MKRQGVSIGLFFFIVALLCGVFSGCEEDSEIPTLHREIASLEAEVVDLKIDIGELNVKLHDLRVAIDENASTQVLSSYEVDSLELLIENLTTEIAELKISAIHDWAEEIIEPAEDPPGGESPKDNDVTVYITNTGERYHKGSCGSLWKSKIPIKKSDAIRRGYTQCQRCKP